MSDGGQAKTDCFSRDFYSEVDELRVIVVGLDCVSRRNMAMTYSNDVHCRRSIHSQKPKPCESLACLGHALIRDDLRSILRSNHVEG